MNDARRLRRFLWAATLAAPIASSCGGSARGGAAGPGGKGGGAGADAGPTSVIEDGRRGVMRQPPPDCESGSWCGPGGYAKRFATEVPEHDGCPTHLVDPEGTSYVLREDDTRAARKAGEADTCCYDWQARCYRDDVIEGRPLVDEVGVRHVAPGVRGGAALAGAGWGEGRAHRGDAALPAALRAALAAAWEADALNEHASIASFARHTLELMAVGAPAGLIAEVQRAALDEVAHAEGAFALAARFAGAPRGPGALPALAPRRLDAAALAAAVFAEGCVGESIAALAARRALARCEDEEARKHLERVAEDEERHAALAWRTLRALGVKSIERRAPEVAAPIAGVVPDARWAAYGRLTAAEEAACVTDAWREVIQPLAAGLEPEAAS